MEMILGVVIGAFALLIALMGRTLHVLKKHVAELRAQQAANELAQIIPPEGEHPPPVPHPERKRCGALATVTAIGTCTRHTFRHTIKRNRFTVVAAVATATATAVTVAALVVLGERTSSGTIPPEAGPPPTSAPDQPGPDRPTPSPSGTPDNETATATPSTKPMGNDVQADRLTPRPRQSTPQPAPPRAGERTGDDDANAGQAPAQPPTATPPPRTPIPTPSVTTRHCLKVTVSLVPRPAVGVCLR